MAGKPRNRKKGPAGRNPEIGETESAQEGVTPEPQELTQGEIHAYKVLEGLQEVSELLTEVNTAIYNAIYDDFEVIDDLISSVKSTIAIKIATQYTPIILAVNESRDMIRDRLQYKLASVNEILGQTPAGIVHTPKQVADQNAYRQAFLTGTLPLHGVPDPPGETIADVARVFNPNNVTGLSLNTAISIPGEPLGPAPTPTPTPAPTPTPTPPTDRKSVV